MNTKPYAPWMPDFEKIPMADLEAALDAQETSWADFVYGARTGRRHIRSERRQLMNCRGLAAVHRILDHHRQDYLAGQRIAIFSALILCADENVPMPYWLADELIAINNLVNKEPASLHALMGLERLIPAEGKKAKTSRRDVKLQHAIWGSASKLIAEASRSGSPLSIDEAVKAARALINFPYKQTKAREMFDAQARIQSAHLAAATTGGKRTHRVKK